jgi:glycine oxidase
LNVNFIVLGAGLAGLTSAQFLLMSGASVLVLERGEVGRESSWAGGGILSPLCPWDYPEAVTRLTTRGAQGFADWAAELHQVTGIDPEYEPCGMWVSPPLEWVQAQAWCAKQGVKSKVQTLNDVGEQVGLLLPEVAHVRNPRLLQALRRRVEMLGGQIVEQCGETEILVQGREVSGVQTALGQFRAEQYVLAAGAWSKQMLGQYALNLDIKPVRGQMLLFKFSVPPLPHIVLHEGMYLIPRRDGHLLVGSTLEDVGFDKSTTVAALKTLRTHAEQLLPALRGLPVLQHWSGLRPASPHNIPTIGRHAQLENLSLNTGHFRYGVTMALSSAEILWNGLNGLEQPFDVMPYQL